MQRGEKYAAESDMYFILLMSSLSFQDVAQTFIYSLFALF